MTLSFYTTPLSELGLPEIQRLLNMEGPLADRPSEGARLKYKQDFVEDLGETVAAFANTYGGIVLLGVADDNGQPREICGVPRRGELAMRISSHIEATVRPEPRIEVRTLALPGHEGRDIALIRVIEGDWPPYMSSRADRRRVMVRQDARNRDADYLQMDRLIAARKDHTKDLRMRGGLAGGLRPRALRDGKYANEAFTYHVIRLVPVREGNITIDRRVERVLQDNLAPCFEDFRERHGVETIRYAGSVDFEYAPTSRDYFRVWRFQEDGTLGLGTQIMMPGASTASLYDMALDALLVFRWAGRVFPALDLQGRVSLIHELRVGELAMLEDQGARSLPVGLGGPRRTTAIGTMSRAILDSHELREPARVLAESFCALWRNEWGANISIDRLSVAIADLDQEATSQGDLEDRHVPLTE